MITSGLVNLYTRDIEAGVRFYRDALGLRETFRTPTVGTPEHVDATFETLEASGAPVVQGPHDADNGNRSALLRDPDGNLVELVAKRPASNSSA